MNYQAYRFLWPPRPVNKVLPASIGQYDNGTFIAQPKLNGSNILVFMNESEIHIKNRHGEDKTGQINVNFRALYEAYNFTGWVVLNGEWMEKSKTDETGTNFNGNFCIFEILVHESKILIGTKVADRITLLYEIFRQEVGLCITADGRLQGKDYLYQTRIPGIWRISSYLNGFHDLYEQLSPVDMVEGLVLKNKSAILMPLFTQNANSGWAIKCRKPAKNYIF